MYNQQTIPITPQVLLQALQGEANAIAYYTQLYNLATDPQEKNLLQSIHNDETSHYQSLASLYQQLTGQSPPTPQPAVPEIASYSQGVKAAILDELRDSEFYRCIALNCDNPSQRLFNDFVADENKHAAWLNYLYIHSLEHCCSQVPEPAPEPEPEPEPGPEPIICDGVAHTVQPGDSLWSIGVKYAVTVEELLSANPQITDSASIYTGQIICIPCSGIRYTMQTGDSLWLIAQRHGLSVEDLVAANPLLSDPANIAVGQIVCIPVVTPPVQRESLTYLYGGTSAYYLDLLAHTQGSISVVCPDFFELDDSGNLLLASSEKLNTPFIDALHQKGLRVTPFLSNHWNRGRGITALGNREQLSTQIADAVAQYQLDGVNIDIENVTHEHREIYVDFMRLLREKLPSDKVVSIAVAANPNGWATGWHGSYDYKALAEYCDYLVIMAYDESYQGGPEGPVSSIGFFEQSILYALNQGVPKEKLIVGMPFFGRYWKQGDSVGGIGLADRDVESLLANYSSSAHYDSSTQSALAVVTVQPDDPVPQIWGNRTLTPGNYRIWYDNLEATCQKLQMIAGYGLLGAGSWALGQEMPEVWNFYFQTSNQ